MWETKSGKRKAEFPDSENHHDNPSDLRFLTLKSKNTTTPQSQPLSPSRLVLLIGIKISEKKEKP